MGIDDSGLNALRSPTNDELLPFEHSFSRIPSLITHANLSVFCRVKRKGCAVRLEKRSSFMCLFLWSGRSNTTRLLLLFPFLIRQGAETVAFLRSIPGMAAGGARKARSAFFSPVFGGCSVGHCGSVFVTFGAPVGLLPASA